MLENTLEAYKSFWYDLERYALIRQEIDTGHGMTSVYVILDMATSSLLALHDSLLANEVTERMKGAGAIILGDRNLISKWQNGEVELTTGSLLQQEATKHTSVDSEQAACDKYEVLCRKVGEYGLLCLARADGTSRCFVLQIKTSRPVIIEDMCYESVLSSMQDRHAPLFTAWPSHNY